MTADAWVISIASAMATACIMSTDFVISSAGRKLMPGGLRSLAALEMPGRTMPGRTMPGQHHARPARFWRQVSCCEVACSHDG